MTKNFKDGSKKTNIRVKTDGRGLWSSTAKTVIINKIVWYSTDIDTQVELYLDENTWSQDEDGLIYTDKAFKRNIKRELCYMKDCGELPDLPWEKISYTEQGMQGGHMFGCPDNCNSRHCKLYVHMILGDW
jgi:hypothetical protein